VRIAVLGALIATGVGAAAMAAAGTGGLTAGSFFSTLGGGFTTGFAGAGGFGQMMTAGLFGASGAGGVTAGLLGSGGVGLGAAGMFGATASTAGAALAGTTGASVFAGGGASLSGGALFGGGSVGTAIMPSATATAVAGAAPTTVMGKIGKWAGSAVSAGGKMVVGGLMMNAVMGDREEDPLYRSGSGRATSFSSNTREMVDVGQYVDRYSSSSRSDLSGIYGTMMNNLAYGNGSLDYARNTQVALMSGINVAPIQYT
tara:strand:- start:6610 stop:7383 length:774 start_codon:yes stop_codon:yes gene_type:complete